MTSTNRASFRNFNPASGNSTLNLDISVHHFSIQMGFFGWYILSYLLVQFCFADASLRDGRDSAG